MLGYRTALQGVDSWDVMGEPAEARQEALSKLEAEGYNLIWSMGITRASMAETSPELGTATGWEKRFVRHLPEARSPIN